MAATVEICESNGAGETVSHNIANINFGNTDASALTPASFPITAGNNSFGKWIRLHWSAGTANKIDNIQIWKASGAYVTGEGIQTNLRTSAYGGAPTYATPSTTTYTDQVMPTADPGAANLGIAGSLSGSLVAVGYSDYWRLQLQTTGSTPAGDVNQKTFTIQYDEQ